MRILLIEDDIKLTRLIERVLRAEHYAVDTAHDGASGLELGLRGSYAVAIIDWMLPEQDGPSVCRALRAARVPTAILMLTARSQVEDRVLGLDSGADDYLTKPFAFEELLARLRALGRRFTPLGSDGDELRSGAVVLDVRAHVARRGSATLDLTATEWSLLECLLRNPNQTLSRQQLLDYVWSYDRDVQPSLVDVYISYLRKKLQAAGPLDPIQTVRGIGYRWSSDNA
jgi:DNA-binding response OmpR family regulator